MTGTESTSDTPDTRVSLVTGASSGIGRATAHLLAERGERLVLAARSEDTLEQARQECLARGAGDVLVVPTDVGDGKAVAALFEAALDAFGRVDAVAHAAAVLAYGEFTDIPAEVYDRVLTTNVTGTANVAREAMRHFAERPGGGALVVVGSVLGKITAPYMSPYATSKWALAGLVRTLQLETRGTEVHVSLVSPGGVNTPIYDQAGSFMGRGGHPPPPVTGPERVAEAIVEAFDKPRREVDVGYANALMVAGFRLLPRVYDGLVGPLMSRLGLGREPVADNPGNVFEPRPEGESTRGRWSGILG